MACGINNNEKLVSKLYQSAIYFKGNVNYIALWENLLKNNILYIFFKIIVIYSYIKLQMVLRKYNKFNLILIKT
jgi:hypothetical protein